MVAVGRGAMSRDGRIARDVMLGLMKTCQKLGLSVYHYFGDRPVLRSNDHPIPPLSATILASA